MQSHNTLHSSPLGESLPPGDEHAISVSLPTWEAHQRWAKKDPSLNGVMQTGYPRFFYHRWVNLLGQVLLRTARISEERFDCLPFGGNSEVIRCRGFVCTNFRNKTSNPVPEMIRSFCVRPRWGPGDAINDTALRIKLKSVCDQVTFYAVIYPKQLSGAMKAYWQHSGCGISSRKALFLLRMCQGRSLLMDLGSCNTVVQWDVAPNSNLNLQIPHMPTPISFLLMLENKLDVHHAKLARRDMQQYLGRISSIKEGYVALFPNGMMAISCVFHAILAAGCLPLASRDVRRSYAIICFGFSYVDTWKVIDKFRGCYGNDGNRRIYAFLIGRSCEAGMSELETMIENCKTRNTSVLAVFCEFPSNPLLHSPDLMKLNKLARKNNFILVCDDTVGTSVNVHVSPHVDVIVTSLTKMWSGKCDVMGGCAIMPKASPWLSEIATHLNVCETDPQYFTHDIIQMHVNCQDFQERVWTANITAELLCLFLRTKFAKYLKFIYYPKYCATEMYDLFKKPGGGYGYLFSLEFHKDDHARAFFDALDVSKGPSLGTNFTLACAYTLLAHGNDLEWAKKYGVNEHLIRISVGQEPFIALRAKFEEAMQHLCRFDEQKLAEGLEIENAAKILMLMRVDPRYK